MPLAKPFKLYSQKVIAGKSLHPGDIASAGLFDPFMGHWNLMSQETFALKEIPSDTFNFEVGPVIQNAGTIRPSVEALSTVKAIEGTDLVNRAHWSSFGAGAVALSVVMIDPWAKSNQSAPWPVEPPLEMYSRQGDKEGPGSIVELVKHGTELWDKFENRVAPSHRSTQGFDATLCIWRTGPLPHCNRRYRNWRLQT